MESLEALLSLLIGMFKRKFLLPRLVLSPSRLERLARVDSAYFAAKTVPSAPLGCRHIMIDHRSNQAGNVCAKTLARRDLADWA